MKILFLDDDPVRHARFQKAHVGADVTYVWNSDDAIKELKENTKETFDFVSLDHDLAAQKNMELPPAGEGSGYDVALFIASMPMDKQPKLAVIHSFNPEGARRMRIVLNKAGIHTMRIPFNY